MKINLDSSINNWEGGRKTPKSKTRELCDTVETGCSDKEEGVIFMTYMDLNQYIGFGG